MSEILDKILIKLGLFLKNFIYPFMTPFFAVLNYLKMRELLIKDKAPNWAKAFLFMSVIYLIFTFSFGLYWLTKNIKEWSLPK